MNSNNTIPASLDLTQSLKSFEQTIAAEMSLSDVRQWDGRTGATRKSGIKRDRV